MGRYRDQRTLILNNGSNTVIAGPNPKRVSVTLSTDSDGVFISFVNKMTAAQQGMRLFAGMPTTFTADNYGDALQEEINAFVAGAGACLSVLDIMHG